MNKIPDISSFVRTTVLNTHVGEAENKICDFSGLVKETGYNTKTSDTGAKCLTIFDYNKFTSKILETKIKEK